MATSNTILKDVVAYVDVWASEKNANYSKPFVQQLQEMGAQVSKTFNKQVTHVIFSFGHPATWSKAKKNNVRLVSVLWVGRCYDDGVRADEELYPALNDESNPVLKNKKHRCMQPKDPPSRTPENDRRMKKKLDKMMKDLAPKQPMVTDVSPYPPIFIDEENGIIYSPSLKRSEYMAKRLKDMKEKREKLLSTASQIVESCSPTGLKPSIGSTPTVLKLKYDESDDDSSADVAEPGYSPDKEEGRTQVDVSAPEHLEHMKSTEKPWLSPCRDVPKRITSPLKCPDFTDEDFTSQTKSRRSSARKKSTGKNKSVGLLESPCQDERSDNTKNFQKAKRRLEITSSSPSPSKSEKGKGKVKAAKSFTETKTHFFPDTMNSASCLSPPATVGHAVVEPSKETPTPLQKIPKRARPSISAMVRSLTVSGIKSVASCSTDGDDNVFEDYFSPANHHKKSQKSLLPNLPVEKDIKIPFELGSAANKRKPRRSESVASETNSKKKRKLEECQRGRSPKQQSDASSIPQSQPQQDVNESPPASNNPGANKTLIAKRRRQSTLSFTSTNTTPGEAVEQRRASTSAQQTLVLEANTVSDRSQTFESRGNECTVSAGSTEIPSEGEENLNEQVSLNLQKMVNKAKVMRTLVMTSMPTEKQQTVSQVVETLGGFSVVDRVSESTTHVVSGSNRRTLNILLGIARGCWILSFEWILWCLEQRQWIPEEPYELSDQFPAAQICRLQRHLSAGEHQQDLFQGLPAIFVSPQAQPPAQSLVELIQLCGGTVCKTVRQAGICIGKYNGRRPEGTKVLSEQWVLDCITSLKQLSYDKYDFE